MEKITRFEDLICWQKARLLVSDIYHITKTGQLSKDFGLRDQLRRARVSVMTNIAEGFSRFHNKEFVRFLNISQSSASEVISLLYITLDNGYLNKDEVLLLQKRARETRAVTLGLLKYVNKSRSSNKISEPVGNYGDRQTSIILPDEFINSEHITTLTQ